MSTLVDTALELVAWWTGDRKLPVPDSITRETVYDGGAVVFGGDDLVGIVECTMGLSNVRIKVVVANDSNVVVVFDGLEEVTGLSYRHCWNIAFRDKKVVRILDVKMTIPDFI